MGEADLVSTALSLHPQGTKIVISYSTLFYTVIMKLLLSRIVTFSLDFIDV